jgi:hypothetical protein
MTGSFVEGPGARGAATWGVDDPAGVVADDREVGGLPPGLVDAGVAVLDVGVEYVGGVGRGADACTVVAGGLMCCGLGPWAAG